MCEHVGRFSAGEVFDEAVEAWSVERLDGAGYPGVLAPGDDH